VRRERGRRGACIALGDKYETHPKSAILMRGMLCPDVRSVFSSFKSRTMIDCEWQYSTPVISCDNRQPQAA
jgi:hypothetical protein